jgi:hypothetical protein
VHLLYMIMKWIVWSLSFLQSSPGFLGSLRKDLEDISLFLFGELHGLIDSSPPFPFGELAPSNHGRIGDSFGDHLKDLFHVPFSLRPVPEKFGNTNLFIFLSLAFLNHGL